jgi:hypothetical protein
MTRGCYSLDTRDMNRIHQKLSAGALKHAAGDIVRRLAGLAAGLLGADPKKSN